MNWVTNFRIIMIFITWVLILNNKLNNIINPYRYEKNLPKQIQNLSNLYIKCKVIIIVEEIIRYLFLIY